MDKMLISFHRAMRRLRAAPSPLSAKAVPMIARGTSHHADWADLPPYHPAGRRYLRADRQMAASALSPPALHHAAEPEGRQHPRQQREQGRPPPAKMNEISVSFFSLMSLLDSEL